MPNITRRKFCTKLIQLGADGALICLASPLLGNPVDAVHDNKQKSTQDALNLNSMLQPVPESAVLEMDDWYVWGGSVVKDNRLFC